MPNKTVLISGVKGQLGQKVREAMLKHRDLNVIGVDLDEMDIVSRREVEAKLQEIQPEVLINCSAYTNVDQAENEKEMALKVNQRGPQVLAEKCKLFGTLLIHVSTDYVFSGESFRPYNENDPTRPVNFYGETKALGEEAIQQIYNNSIILRTAWLYSEHGKNFVKTMLRLGSERKKLGVIDDQVGTPTYAGDLANAIEVITLHFLEGEDFARGIYHFANEGVCSWFDFALKIQQMAGNSVMVNPIPTADYPTPAKRPHYSVLDKRKIKNQFHITIPHWEQSLKKCIDILKG